jgi:hypothetical protein
VKRLGDQVDRASRRDDSTDAVTLRVRYKEITVRCERDVGGTEWNRRTQCRVAIRRDIRSAPQSAKRRAWAQAPDGLCIGNKDVTGDPDGNASLARLRPHGNAGCGNLVGRRVRPPAHADERDGDDHHCGG